jgi:hypothetical protein
VPRKGALELVKDLLGEGAHSTTFGESGSAKTFLTLELAVCVALGRSFLGRQTKQAPVVYFVGEGSLGMQKRVAAHSTLLGGQSPPILFFPYSLDVPEGVEEVLRLVEEASTTFGRPPGLVILDTLNCYFGDGDENSTRDMKRYVDASRRLLEKCPTTHVNHVHHTGKDLSRGMRGSSVFRAAVDTAIECSKLGTGRFEAKVDKQKDGEEGMVFPFRLESIEIEINGKPDHSCVVKYDAPGATLGPQPRLPLPEGFDKTAFDIVRELRTSTGVIQLELSYKEQYLERWYATFPTESKDTLLKRAQKGLKTLRDTYRAIEWQAGSKTITVLPPFSELSIQFEQRGGP